MTRYLITTFKLFLFALIVNLIGCGSTDESDTLVLNTNYYTDLYAWNEQGGLAQTQLGRGLNLGNYLDAPNEGDWTDGRLLVEDDLQNIAGAGFKTVRIPTRWASHADTTSPYTIESTFMARVKEVVGWAHAAGLKVVLNVHHYNEMMEATEADQEAHILRLLAIWKQISEQFTLSDYDQDNLVFELLNEPNGTIDYDDWNDIIARLLTLIWEDMSTQQNDGSHQRKVMIGTANWGGTDGLTNLILPDSVNNGNTLVTVHYYQPFYFTHQGAEWVDGADEWIGTTWLGSDAEQAPLIELFDAVSSWNSDQARGFEIFMGEFGAYSKYVDPTHQKAWTAFIAREAEKRNFSWAYWEYASGFGAYDPDTATWRTQLIEALVPVQ